MFVLPAISSHLFHRAVINYGEIHWMLFSASWKQAGGGTHARKAELSLLWTRFGIHLLTGQPLKKEKYKENVFSFLFCSPHTVLRWAEPIHTSRNTATNFKICITSTLKGNRKIKYLVFKVDEFLFVFSSSLSHQDLFVLRGIWSA